MKLSRLRTCKSYQSIVLILLLLFVAASFLAGMRCGSLELSFGGILSTLWDGSAEDVNYQILCNIRLPRVLLGGLVGAALAISGAILQGVMLNPLAAPGIIGVSAGGALAGILIMLVLPQFSGMMIPAAVSACMEAGRESGASDPFRSGRGEYAGRCKQHGPDSECGEGGGDS